MRADWRGAKDPDDNARTWWIHPPLRQSQASESMWCCLKNLITLVAQGYEFYEPYYLIELHTLIKRFILGRRTGFVGEAHKDERGMNRRFMSGCHLSSPLFFIPGKYQEEKNENCNARDNRFFEMIDDKGIDKERDKASDREGLTLLLL